MNRNGKRWETMAETPEIVHSTHIWRAMESKRGENCLNFVLKIITFVPIVLGNLRGANEKHECEWARCGDMDRMVQICYRNCIAADPNRGDEIANKTKYAQIATHFTVDSEFCMANVSVNCATFFCLRCNSFIHLQVLRGNSSFTQCTTLPHTSDTFDDPFFIPCGCSPLIRWSMISSQFK